MSFSAFSTVHCFAVEGKRDEYFLGALSKERDPTISLVGRLEVRVRVERLSWNLPLVGLRVLGTC